MRACGSRWHRRARSAARLRLQLDGKTQRQIASELGMSLGLVNKRIAEGTSYLVVLQGIEHGIGT